MTHPSRTRRSSDLWPWGAGASGGNRAGNWTGVRGWLAASRAASTMRLIRIGSIGTRPWVMSWQKAVPSREAGEALPFKGRVGWGWLSRQPEQSAWQNRSVTEIHPHPDLPLEGEGEIGRAHV